MYLGQEIRVMGNWFIIHFTENNGMAFGMEFEGAFGKLFLSLFRIFAVIGIGVYLYMLIRRKSNSKLILSMSLIFAGAMGNILDSIFYGRLFSSSEYQLAAFLPKEGGYASFLHGKVVDMFYFPLIEGHFPEWFPIWGGEDFIFFRPVFNIADSSITIGVFLILIFQSTIFHEKKETHLPENENDFLSPESFVQVNN
jgi:signal peptidase II